MNPDQWSHQTENKSKCTCKKTNEPDEGSNWGHDRLKNNMNPCVRRFLHSPPHEFPIHLSLFLFCLRNEGRISLRYKDLVILSPFHLKYRCWGTRLSKIHISSQPFLDQKTQFLETWPGWRSSLCPNSNSRTLVTPLVSVLITVTNSKATVALSFLKIWWSGDQI